MGANLTSLVTCHLPSPSRTSHPLPLSTLAMRCRCKRSMSCPPQDVHSDGVRARAADGALCCPAAERCAARMQVMSHNLAMCSALHCGYARLLHRRTLSSLRSSVLQPTRLAYLSRMAHTAALSSPIQVKLGSAMRSALVRLCVPLPSSTHLPLPLCAASPSPSSDAHPPVLSSASSSSARSLPCRSTGPSPAEGSKSASVYPSPLLARCRRSAGWQSTCWSRFTSLR